MGRLTEYFGLRAGGAASRVVDYGGSFSGSGALHEYAPAESAGPATFTVDTSVLADVADKLAFLNERCMQRIFKGVCMRAAERAKWRVVANLSGKVLQVDTGEYRNAFAKSEATFGSHRKGKIVVGVAFPTREELGIKPDDPYFYPAALEYGHAAPGYGRNAPGVPALKRGESSPKHVKPYPHIRPAIDNHIEAEKIRIGADLREEISAEFDKIMKRMDTKNKTEIPLELGLLDEVGRPG